VALYGKARLAALVCAHDKAAGSKLFQEAWSDLKRLPDDAFDIALTPLPVSTFSAMWRLVMPAARSCDPNSSWNDEHLDDRRLREYGKTNLWLNKAHDMADPHRTAQLADAAISVGSVGGEYFAKRRLPNPILFVDVLVKLASTAPDLSDPVFKKAISVPPFNVAQGPYDLELFARYLFPGAPSVRLHANPRSVNPADPPMIPNFTRSPLRGNLDLLAALLDSTVSAAPIPDAPYYDLAGAYTLAYQMLPKARLYAPDYAWKLQGALSSLETQPDSYAAANRASIGPVPEGAPAGPAQRDQFLSTARALSDTRAGRFQTARRTLAELGKTDLGHQVEELIDFAEIADSLKTANPARLLEKPVYPNPGAKRALLYASAAAAAHTREVKLKALDLALQDVSSLPSAQRACLFTALAGVSLPEAPDVALAFFERSIEDVNGSPAEDREQHSEGGHPSIRCGPEGMVEIVNATEPPQSILLSVPGVSIYTTTAFISHAKDVDFPRLEAAVQQLRDPTRLAQALAALAELRLGSARR
jgi:hypothetical protein